MQFGIPQYRMYRLDRNIYGIITYVRSDIPSRVGQDIKPLCKGVEILPIECSIKKAMFHQESEMVYIIHV